ncbi:MAG TPA: DinB family protein [Thermoanaerobaculia bacterium]|jgi:uncharacterized damage-inducible protein DinB|nr:DinB family protein [Thermoanaerobaculia bacterium]
MHRIDSLLKELQDAYDGEPWYGDSLRRTLDGVDESRLRERPRIAELVAHITSWIEITNRRLDGEIFEVTEDVNFRTPGAWSDDLARLDKAHRALLDRVAKLPEADLDRQIAGKRQTAESAIRGVVQHNIYHQGQIALLRK